MNGLFPSPLDEAKERAKRLTEPSVSVCDIIMHNGQETRAVVDSMIDGKTGANWNHDEQARHFVHQRGKTHMVRVMAEEGEELALVGKLISSQGLDSAILLMYVLSCLSPNLDPNGRCRVWIDTAEAARKCGLLPRETRELKDAARIKVTETLIYGERATVIGKRTYRDGKSKAEASSVVASYWGVLDAEYLDADINQNGLPSSGGRRIPLNPVVPPVRVFVVLSDTIEKLITVPEWRQYLVGLRAVAEVPAGKPSGQIARALGFAFMSQVRMQMEAAASDIKALMNGEEPGSMKARPRRWWLENFGVDVHSKTYQDHPSYMVEHWAEALEKLAGAETNGGAELIARRGEAASAADSMATRGTKPRGWYEEWLDEPVRFTPGPALAGQVLSFMRNESLPVGVARILLNKPGRPGRKKALPGVVKIPSSPIITGTSSKG